MGGDRTSGAAAEARTRPVIVRLSPDNEQLALGSVGASRIVFCTSDEEVAAVLDASPAAGIVWELSRRMPYRGDPVPEAVIHAARKVPLLVYAEVSAPSMRQIVALAARIERVRVSLQGFDDLASAITEMQAAATEPSAEPFIIRALAPVTHAAVQELVLSAAIACRRRCTVRDLARLCNCTTGTLRYRLWSAGAPTPRGILGELTALHAAWRRGVLGWSCKRTAFGAGYTLPAALDRYVRGYVGLRLREMGDVDCFSRLLERFASRFRPEAA